VRECDKLNEQFNAIEIDACLVGKLKNKLTKVPVIDIEKKNSINSIIFSAVF
jgi:hypothetical protein